MQARMSQLLLDTEEDENEDEGVTGEDILSGARTARVHVPDRWTSEYAGFRMVEAFQHLRRAFVGRVGPKGAQGFWPEVLHDFEDMRGWATDHRKRVEDNLARNRTRPSSTDLARMDESLAWPMQYLAPTPLFADAVVTWAYTTAWDIDPGHFLAFRKRKANELASAIAERENVTVKTKRAEALADIEAWAMKQFVERKVNKKPAIQRDEAIQRVRNQAMNRAERALRDLPLIKPNPTLAMPNRVLAVSTLGRLRLDGLEALAIRLDEARVPVR